MKDNNKRQKQKQKASSLKRETTENIRKRVDERLVTDKNKLSKVTSKPT